MSFPWAHLCRPVMRTIPRDIDEISGIAYPCNELLANLSHSKFFELKGVAGRELPEGSIATVQRSNDPGVLEYTTLFPPTRAQKASYPPFHAPTPLNGDPSVKGELALRKYEETQGRKRRRELIDSSNMKTIKISFRVGSTSSRATIFETNESNAPLFLLAELPVEVEYGKRMPSSKSEELARSLGNYDCRYGFNKSSNGETGRQEERVRVGRTRLIWTQPDRSVSQRSFKSLLDGRPKETGAHKRPRNVKVALRVNKTLVVGPACVLTQRLFDDAVDTASTTIENPRDETRQCSLDPVSLLAEVEQGEASSQGSEQELSLSSTYTVSLQHNFGLTEMTVVPPKIECLCSQDGFVYTMCAKRGSLASRTILQDSESGRGELSTGEQFLDCVSIMADMTSMDRQICSVCWSNYGIDGSAAISCQSCQMTVHKSCYGRPIRGDQWKCDSCNMLSSSRSNPCATPEKYRQYRWGLTCSMCQEKGGSMFRHEASGTWIHDTCRIWSTSEVNPPPRCALCNKGTRPIIRCAAKNCEVMFHPICAIVASNAADLRRLESKPSAEQNKESQNTEEHYYKEDLFLSTQYRLSRLEVGSSAMNDTKVLAVGFCGYHNPSRQPDVQGLYPCGKHLNKAMRIPPLNEDEK